MVIKYERIIGATWGAALSTPTINAVVIDQRQLV